MWRAYCISTILVLCILRLGTLICADTFSSQQSNAEQCSAENETSAFEWTQEQKAEKPVIDFKNKQLQQLLLLGKSGEEEYLKAIESRIITGNVARLDAFSRPVGGRPMRASAIIFKYYAFFDHAKLHEWLVKIADAEDFYTNILHPLKKPNIAKMEYALLDFDSKINIKYIYKGIREGRKIGDMPVDLRNLVRENENLFNPGELAEWKKIEDEKSKRKVAQDESVPQKKEAKNSPDKQKQIEELKAAQEAKLKADKKAKEENDKSDELLKSAKRWLSEDNKEVAIRRLQELLQRFPKTKAAAEAKTLLGQIAR